MRMKEVPVTQPSPGAFRTTDETNTLIRIETAALTVALGGRRLVYDKVIAAAFEVARNHRDEMLELLQ
jgi:hypothetical protein